MADNELLLAINCQWRGGMKKRNGISKYQTSDWSGFTTVRGGGRFYINGAWATVVALDTGAVVNFYYGAGTVFAAIDNTFDWTTAMNVEMAELNGYIVCTNGTDKPAVINYDGGWQVQNLETLVTRTRADADWWAGQWDDDATPEEIDDTTDAQDAGVDDFQIASATDDDGYYISCNAPFTKVVFVDAQAAAGNPVAAYEYWNGTGWSSVGALVTTPVWTEAEADRTLEFNIPLDPTGALTWEPYNVSGTGLSNKYFLRIQFTTAPTGAFSCDSLEVYHTQYLTQICENEKPSTVYTHNSRIHLGFDNIINISPYNAVIGWREGESQYFSGGGRTIMQMLSHQDQLVVVKDDALFTMTGTSYDTWVTSRPLTAVGAISRRSAASVGGYVFFQARDGIYAWNGTDANKVSNHIRSEIEGWTLTDTAGTNYKGEYWLSFPTEAVVLTTDPDTVRNAAAGEDINESRASFFKFSGYEVSGWIQLIGHGDSGLLLGLGNDGTNPCLAKCDVGKYDWTATPITDHVRTRYFSDSGHIQKKYTRLRIKLADVVAGGGPHALTLYSDDGDVSDSQTITVDTGTGYYETYVSVPYTLDGRNLAVDVQNATVESSKLISLAFEYVKRRF